ncbi:unnamed protein product [Rotaria sordida]|uniref:D-alanyl-D-alanine carboxypeptidase-like core domain-containing protein n=1 Tax=Rotaria sordida TaxID=392033 RepID=A0A815CLH4_9BILA|nr:unnamed protein product [Rotaria sordida]CAF3672163.1 unnamed protein product [Rotaria sordida]
MLFVLAIITLLTTFVVGDSCESYVHPQYSKVGRCISTSNCAYSLDISGLCESHPTDVKCWFSALTNTSNELCGNYIDSTVFSIVGNGDIVYSVVKILKEHLSDPSIYSAAPTDKDNTMTTTTACAFDKMATAAKQTDVTITIASGFRTIARQEYFWHCYQTGSCNGGNLAAPPGTSNHGRGIALDLNTDCGSQSGSRPSCGGSAVYQWLYNNAHNYGFTRTVQSEPWHWEYVGAGATLAEFS